MTYKQIIEKVVKDVLLDFASFRVVLVYWALFLNLLMMYLVAFKGVNYLAFVCSFGALTIVYGFFFASKNNQAVLASKASNTDPTAGDREPE